MNELSKEIYLIRHCEARGQAKDAPLTNRGYQQAEQLQFFFKDKGIKTIISSPFLRAIESIEPTAGSLNLPIKEDERLSERILSSKNLPDWEQKLEKTFHDFQLTFHGGESSEQAMKRISQVITEVENNQPTVLVTHGNIMALLLRNYDHTFGFNEWRNLTNPDIYQLFINGNDIFLKRMYNK